MAAKFIIGDYKITEDDYVVTNWNYSIIKKKKNNIGAKYKNIVLFAESLGLVKKDIEYIMKNSTENVIVVCASKRVLSGVRTHKNAKVEYAEGFAEPASPFDVALLIATATDRKYVFDFLQYNKFPMFMVVKVLISNYMYFKIPSNQAVVGWLDQFLFRVNPEMLWAYAAFKFKPEKYIRFLKWNYPKKQEETDD